MNGFTPKRIILVFTRCGHGKDSFLKSKKGKEAMMSAYAKELWECTDFADRKIELPTLMYAYEKDDT